MKLMKLFFSLVAGLLFQSFTAQAQSAPAETMTKFPPVIKNAEAFNALNANESYVLLRKGTERSFSGAYHNFKGKGTFICKQCNLPLFHSKDKFDSGTGWPSFDDVIDDHVEELTDADGRRTEIVCSNCKGHLGHVFRGEGFTRKQTRHCANSASLSFVKKEGKKE